MVYKAGCQWDATKGCGLYIPNIIRLDGTTASAIALVLRSICLAGDYSSESENVTV